MNNNQLNVWRSEWETRPVLNKKGPQSHAHTSNQWMTMKVGDMKPRISFLVQHKSIVSDLGILCLVRRCVHIVCCVHSIVSRWVNNNWISLPALKFVVAGFRFSQWRCAPISVCKLKRFGEMVESVKQTTNREKVYGVYG